MSSLGPRRQRSSASGANRGIDIRRKLYLGRIFFPQVHASAAARTGSEKVVAQSRLAHLHLRPERARWSVSRRETRITVVVRLRNAVAVVMRPSQEITGGSSSPLKSVFPSPDFSRPMAAAVAEGTRVVPAVPWREQSGQTGAPPPSVAVVFLRVGHRTAGQNGRR